MRKALFLMLVMIVAVPLLIPAVAQADNAGTAPECGIFAGGPGYTFNTIDVFTSQSLLQHFFDKCESSTCTAASPFDYDIQLIGTNNFLIQQWEKHAAPTGYIWCEYLCINDPWFSFAPLSGEFIAQAGASRQQKGVQNIGTFSFRDARTGCTPDTSGVTYTGVVESVDIIYTNYYLDMTCFESYSGVPTCSVQCCDQCTGYTGTQDPDSTCSPILTVSDVIIEGPITGASSGSFDTNARAIFKCRNVLDLGQIIFYNFVEYPPGSGNYIPANADIPSKIHNSDMMIIEVQKPNKGNVRVDGNLNLFDYLDWKQGYTSGIVKCFNPWWSCFG